MYLEYKLGYQYWDPIIIIKYQYNNIKLVQDPWVQLSNFKLLYFNWLPKFEFSGGKGLKINIIFFKKSYFFVII